MNRRNVILTIFAITCFIATGTLIPKLGAVQPEKLKTALADLKAKTEKHGAPMFFGNDLYSGTTKVDKSIVDSIARDHGAAATILMKMGDVYVRVLTTLKKEDGTSALGTPLDATNPAVAMLNKGEAYYGDAMVFGKLYIAGYEPIKEKSGAVIGAYFVGQPK